MERDICGAVLPSGSREQGVERSLYCCFKQPLFSYNIKNMYVRSKVKLYLVYIMNGEL